VSGWVQSRNVLRGFLLSICACCVLPLAAFAQQSLGSIVGHVRVSRGDTPPQRVLVTLEMRGAPMESTYTDSSGTFGFHGLYPNAYYVALSDDSYENIRREVIIDPNTMGTPVFVDIILIPKKRDEPEAIPSPNSKGSNPDMIDVREYAGKFPKGAVKEFEKGLSSDAEGKHDDAIRHYLKAIEIAPDFYLAHNNLGSDYQNKSDFPNARKEFERVVQLNQSDAAAFFNLSNVCMLTGQLPEAQQYLDEGLRREPDSALGQFLLGTLDLRLKKPQQAELALLRAIQLSPMMAQPRLQLVNLLLAQNRIDAAASELRDFIEKLPDSPFTAQARQKLQKLEAVSKTTSPAIH
jgi:tetratricopeptide (TPR) repeat protein